MNQLIKSLILIAMTVGDAVIGEDGKIAELSIANSAWPELDESALRAVALWRYERSASCASATGRSETLIDVIFSLH